MVPIATEHHETFGKLILDLDAGRLVVLLVCSPDVFSIATTQAPLQAEENAKAGIPHEAVLDMEKAYEKVDPQLLLELIPLDVDHKASPVIRALLDPISICAKIDPAENVARMTRGVSQGDPSSPVFFEMYIDALATNAEASEHLGCGNKAVIMVADDMLLQTKSGEQLQGMTTIATEWHTERKPS